MAKYISKYKSLGFYVNGEHKAFSNGVYETTDAEEIAVLERVSDAIKQDEPKQTEAKPASKAPARKPSAK
ncbi:hypothetical protein [Psychrobacillus sp. OK032]|uniref:hypothetical protein n=1 Tax=Psychrobacillus sp. OK032 TaxID=1884358 RepID=UPI0008C9D49B|nr:hypothetical protein [Psychrobacillus sp. OK032]SER87426.1 hypothetical protein SAMN05518872_102437 [Psychrobacillus sp. OK032]